MHWKDFPIFIPKLEIYPNYVASDGECLCSLAEFYFLGYLAVIFNYSLLVTPIEIDVYGPGFQEYRMKAVQKVSVPVPSEKGGTRTLLFGDPTLVVIDDIFPGGCFKDLILVPRQPGTTYWAGRQLRRHGFKDSWMRTAKTKQGPLHEEIERAEVSLLGEQKGRYELLYSTLLANCFVQRDDLADRSTMDVYLSPSSQHVNHVAR